MDLNEIRKSIDKIDDEMSKLFIERMDIVKNVAEFKKSTGKAITDGNREKDIIARLVGNTDKEYRYYLRTLYSTMFNLSRSFQSSLLLSQHTLSSLIKEKVETTGNEFPESAVIACQGIEGSYSQIATEKLFKIPNILFFENFNAIFHAVEKGMCKYGILPIENSSSGSVTQVYELMKERNFYITRSISLKIDHCLLAKSNVKQEDIKIIYSHEQAIAQCGKFLEGLPNAEVKVCENTAVAAQMVAESSDEGIASISSRECASQYGLSILSDTIQNSDNNYTRFICITKDLQIYPGADRMSIMFTIPHRPGALFELMSKFAAAGLNLTKLESRPITGRDFEFMFYFDFEASVYSEIVLNLLDDLSVSLTQFKFLGSYLEK